MKFATITKEEVKEKLDRGERLQIVDIRPFTAYWQGHIRGAVNVPYDKIGDRAREVVSPDEPIVLYGDDENDLLVERAAESFLTQNFDLKHIALLPDGVTGWRGAGYFTVSGDEPL